MSAAIALASAALFVCSPARAVDGDTLRCGAFGLVRLQGIDAPEMPGHCRAGRVCTPGDGRRAMAALAHAIKRGPVTCMAAGRDAYGRLLARCESGRVDLSCTMLASGQAVRRYAVIRCR